MIETSGFKFLNLEYLFCILYSLFGGKCTVVETVGGSVASSSISGPLPGGGAGVATGTPAELNFWAWLFGGGTGESGEAGVGGSSLVDAVSAGPAAGIFAFIGGVVSFVWGLYSAIAYTVSGILILLIVGAAVGLFLIRSGEVQKYSTLTHRPESSTRLRSRWQQLLDLAISVDPKEWRTAILEADAMLGELLEKVGYAGEGTAERLRAVPEGAFVTLPNAWEAHRIRNFVAAKTSDYILTQREAFRVMKLYEQVFEEFHFI